MIIDTPWMPNVLGGGDVAGPASATDNAVARFDGTTGKLIQNSVVTIADTTGAIAGAQSLTSPAATNLTLGTGSFGTALTVASATGGATFAGAVTAPNLTLNSTGSKIEANTAGTTQKFLQFSSNGAGVYFGIESSAGDTFFTGSAAYDSVIYTPNNPLFISTTTLKLKGAQTISATTAGSSGAGALIVQGGISAGNTGAASYFGGAVTVTTVNATTAAGGFTMSQSTVGEVSVISARNTNAGTDASVRILLGNNLSASAAQIQMYGSNDSTNPNVFRVGTSTSGTTMIGTINNATITTTSSTGFAISSGLALKLGNAYVAGAVVGTGSITIQDSTGTTYRIPVLV